jgi:hypothetical protein
MYCSLNSNAFFVLTDGIKRVKMKRISVLFLLMATMLTCRNEATNTGNKMNPPVDFNPYSLKSDTRPVNEVTGQMVYLPVYSNVPYQIDTLLFSMSAFVAVHNTDLFNPIQLLKVLYFNQDGKLVDNFLGEKTIKIDPLATKDFYIPYEDKSGTGANFLIEWSSDTLVTEPLIESVTICLKPHFTVAVLSQGKIMREKR